MGSFRMSIQGLKFDWQMRLAKQVITCRLWAQKQMFVCWNLQHWCRESSPRSQPIKQCPTSLEDSLLMTDLLTSICHMYTVLIFPHFSPPEWAFSSSHTHVCSLWASLTTAAMLGQLYKRLHNCGHKKCFVRTNSEQKHPWSWTRHHSSLSFYCLSHTQTDCSLSEPIQPTCNQPVHYSD